MLGCDPKDRRVARCVAGIQDQCLRNTLELFRPVLSLLGPEWQRPPEQRDQLAQHIAEFSLAGIRALARAGAKQEW